MSEAPKSTAAAQALAHTRSRSTAPRPDLFQPRPSVGVRRNKDGDRSLLDTWWKALREHVEHLPRDAVKRLISVALRSVADGSASPFMRPERIGAGFSLWRELGYLDADASAALAKTIEGAFSHPNIERDGWWQNSIITLTEYSLVEDVLESHDRALVLRAAEDLLGRIARASSTRCVELAYIVVKYLPSSAHREQFAAQAVELVKRELRSSALGTTLYLVELLLPTMSETARSELTDLLIGEAQRLVANESEPFSSGEPIRMLCVLATEIPARRPEILAIVEKLVHATPHVHGARIELDKLWLPSDPGAAQMAATVLTALGDRRFSNVRRVGWWLGKQPDREVVAPIVDMLLGLLLADNAYTRRSAVHALANAGRGGVVNDEQRSTLVSRLGRMAESDESWLVRAAALHALPPLCSTSGEMRLAHELVDSARTAPIALLRRVAEVGQRALAAREPPAANFADS